MKNDETRENVDLGKRIILLKTGPGRPVKFPDSNQEMARFKIYRSNNLSLRKIALLTGMSKDMVYLKFVRYGIERGGK